MANTVWACHLGYVATDQATMQTKLARDVAKGFKRLRPSEAKAFALAVPPGFYSAVAGLAALFPDDPAETAKSREAPTLPTKRIKRAAPSIPTKKIRTPAKKAPTLPTKRITAVKKAAQSKKMSRR